MNVKYFSQQLSTRQEELLNIYLEMQFIKFQIKYNNETQK